MQRQLKEAEQQRDKYKLELQNIPAQLEASHCESLLTY